MRFTLFADVHSTEELVNVVTLSAERAPDSVGRTEAVALALIGDEVVGAVVRSTVVLRVVVVDMDDLALGSGGVHEVALCVRALLATVDDTTILGLAPHVAIVALAQVAVVVAVAGTSPARLDSERTVGAGLLSSSCGSRSRRAGDLGLGSLLVGLLKSHLFLAGLLGKGLPVEVLPVLGGEFGEVSLHGFSVDLAHGGNASLGVAPLLFTKGRASHATCSRGLGDGTGTALEATTAGL